MFAGVNAILQKIIPELDQHFVADRMHQAINYEEQEVYIRWFIKYLAVIGQILPLELHDTVIHYTVGNGNRTFKGRENCPNV